MRITLAPWAAAIVFCGCGGPTIDKPQYQPSEQTLQANGNSGIATTPQQQSHTADVSAANQKGSQMEHTSEKPQAEAATPAEEDPMAALVAVCQPELIRHDQEGTIVGSICRVGQTLADGEVKVLEQLPKGVGIEWLHPHFANPDFNEPQCQTTAVEQVCLAKADVPIDTTSATKITFSNSVHSAQSKKPLPAMAVFRVSF